MKDRLERNIDYMRVSITDRCDLRCKYCMPSSLPDVSHSDILRYEEILLICRAAVSVGVNRFKITGGEPFVRKGAADFIAQLKSEPAVKCVTVTTNGILLSDALPKLKKAGIDGINISLDSIDASKYQAITGSDNVGKVISAIEQSVEFGIKTKVNCVLLSENKDQIVPLSQLASVLPIDIRFIELMPIGYGNNFSGPSCDKALELLQKTYPDLSYSNEKRGNGPAVYYKSSFLRGRIGFIGANSHKFCSSCNRVRLTSTGMLKPCLCYDTSTDLLSLVRNGVTKEQLAKTIAGVIYEKPSAHCFFEESEMTEHRTMNEIGG